MAEKKRKIIIISHGMEIGGAEKALLGLLEKIDYSKNDVDLFLFRQSGELFKYIPEKVNVLPERVPYNGFAVPMKSLVFHPRYWKLIHGRLQAKFQTSRYLKKHPMTSENDIELVYSHYYSLSSLPMISETRYDLAISFLTPHFIALEKVNADKKAAWIHTDYSYMEVNKDFETKMWEPYDWIVSISEDCTQGFSKRFPELKEKIVLFENKLPVHTILSESCAIKNPYSEFFPDNGDEYLIFLSIGRYCYPKNFDSIPEIASILRKSDLKFKWFIIGYGTDENIILKKIAEFEVEDTVILLGKKINPYPYILNCDWYIQPSRYEGKSIAVQEAQILHVPPIITNYPTASSQILNGVDGYIVPLNTMKCANAIKAIVSNPENRERVSSYLRSVFNECYTCDVFVLPNFE